MHGGVVERRVMSVITPRPVRHLQILNIVRVDWRRLALLCGAASAPLYFGMDVLVSLLYDGYSYTDQAISELSAVGAPTRSLWLALSPAYSLLVLAFGLGVWTSAGAKRALRVVGACAVGVALTGIVWPFAPMHQREALAAGGGTFSDTLHLIVSGVNTVLFLLSLSFGATALGRRFRLYSIATIVAVLLFGGLNALAAPKVADNEPTPWIGIYERIAVEGSMLWYTVLAIALLRRPSASVDGQS
jgi:hypothetical protein